MHCVYLDPHDVMYGISMSWNGGILIPDDEIHDALVLHVNSIL